jgi:membrane-anchored mycosin MYCP
MAAAPKPARRTAVAVLAAGIGIIGSTAATIPAWAQSSISGGYYASPPPVDMSALPADTGKPDQTYKQTKGCVQRSLGDHVDLKNRPWGQEYLQISKAQEIVRAAKGSVGGDIKVGVIDTGVTPHPWFQGRVVSGGDYVATPTNGKPGGLQDCDGHGTEVAGIIAAKPDADVGFQGVAPDATIVSYRQLSENYGPDNQNQGSATSSSAPPSSSGGSSTGLPPSQSHGGGEPGGTVPGQNSGGRMLGKQGTAGNLKTLAQILRGIADRGDIKVVNMSVDNCRPADGSIGDGERQVQAAVHYAMQHNVVVIAAAGNATDTCKQNDQPDPRRPQTIVSPPWFADDVLSVAAIEDQTGSVAPFSVHGPWVGVAAPGTKIISLDPAEGSTGLANLTIENGNQPSEIQGTSFAAPYVAGVAALIRSMYPDLNAYQVVARIKATAQHPAAPGGRDDFVGYGVIDPLAALTANVPSDGVTPGKPSVQVAALPPADDRNWTPIIVALAGTGGGVLALLITLFVMHTIRRNRSAAAPSTRPR